MVDIHTEISARFAVTQIKGLFMNRSDPALPLTITPKVSYGI